MSLPTSPSSVRVRTWRALKAAGCGSLRDGVYLLPAGDYSTATFDTLAESVRQAGGDALVIAFEARDAEQEAGFIALFDRSADFKAFVGEVTRSRRSLRTATERAARSDVLALASRLDALRSIDFFPSPASAEAEASLEAIRAEGAARWSHGEPQPQPVAITRHVAAEFQGRSWATRRRPWIDRLASAWLIGSFIDPRAKFAWFDPKRKCPKGAIGFDFDGAMFTHAAGKVTFEVLVASFGLDSDEALRRLGEVVHFVDVGGAASEEAAGLETMVRGLQARHADDDALLAAARPIFDALYAGFGAAE